MLTAMAKHYNNLKEQACITVMYDEFAPAIFGFILNNTDSKEEAEEYLILVFIEVYDDIQDKEDIGLIGILKVASRIIFSKKNRAIKLGGLSIPYDNHSRNMLT
jgi:hypothetical protein